MERAGDGEVWCASQRDGDGGDAGEYAAGLDVWQSGAGVVEDPCSAADLGVIEEGAEGPLAGAGGSVEEDLGSVGDGGGETGGEDQDGQLHDEWRMDQGGVH